MTLVFYNDEEKVWSGQVIDRKSHDISFGEQMLNDLEKHGDKLIQIDHDTGERTTCKQMRMKSLKVAEHLEKIGIQRGDHISIVTGQHYNLAPFCIGAIVFGAVINPLNPCFTERELSNYLDIVHPKLIVCNAQTDNTVMKSLNVLSIEPMVYTFSKASNSIRSMDEFFAAYDTEPSTFRLSDTIDLQTTLALIMYSSGTTGLPKGVRISHALALSGLYVHWYHDEDLVFFNTGLPCWIAYFYGLATSNTLRSPRVITAQPLTVDLILEILEQHCVDLVFLPPHMLITMAKRVLTENKNLSYLKVILTGGSYFSENSHILLSKAIPNAKLVVGYGLTEIGCIATLSCWHKTANLAGYLRAGMNAKIVDDDTNCLGPGEVGEIYLKITGCPVLGYLKNDVATANAIDPNGWLRTGDIGYFNADGFLSIVNRKTETIFYKGSRIAPIELEFFVMEQFDLQDFVVVGIPSGEVFGSLVAAAVVPKSNSTVTEADLIKAVADNLSDSKQLRGGVYFLEKLPRTSSGKVQRNQVRQIVMEMHAAKKDAS